MGANTTAVNANLAGLRALLTDILDAINEVNQKSWSGTKQELFEVGVAQTAFIAISNPTNNTATKTSSTPVITSGAAISLFNQYKGLEADTMLAIEALRLKRWTEYNRLMPIVTKTYTDLVTIESAMSLGSAQTTATQGAQAAAMIFEFGTVNQRIKQVTDNIIPMLNARAQKNYVLVNELYEEAVAALAAGASDSIANVSS